MLSYRHAFHAGNHADMLKHLVLYLVLDYYNRKDKAYAYIDTHAGAGLYDLQDAYAQKVGEYQYGWQRLQTAPTLSPLLQAFKAHIDAILPQAHSYCGSPWLAASLLRKQDHAKFYELHPKDHSLLLENIQSCPHHQHLHVYQSNGFQGLIASLPPSSRRAVVLIDPPYELAADYKEVVSTIKASLQRFATGTYLIWYPMLSKAESLALGGHLQALKPDNYLKAELIAQTPRADGFGMFGSGMLVINPPYVLAEQLQQVLPELTQLLAQDSGAKYHLQHHIA